MGKSILNWSGITDSKLSNTSNHPLTNKAATEEFLRQQALLNTKEAELKSLINQANTAINAVKAMRATTTSVGMVQLSTSASATDPNAAALSVTEKNATINDSLANRIANINTNIYSNYVSNVITIPAQMKPSEHVDLCSLSNLPAGKYLVYYSFGAVAASVMDELVVYIFRSNVPDGYVLVLGGNVGLKVVTLNDGESLTLSVRNRSNSDIEISASGNNYIHAFKLI